MYMHVCELSGLHAACSSSRHDVQISDLEKKHGDIVSEIATFKGSYLVSTASVYSTRRL